MNLPFAPFTDDETYLWAFREVVPPLVTAFAPDIVVTQLGCDIHYLDHLTHMALTTQGYTEVVTELGRLAPRWVALGGGGYEMAVVARCWTLAYGVMASREWPDDISPDFQGRYGIKALRDHVCPTVDPEWKERGRRFAETNVAFVKRRVFPWLMP